MGLCKLSIEDPLFHLFPPYLPHLIPHVLLVTVDFSEQTAHHSHSMQESHVLAVFCLQNCSFFFSFFLSRINVRRGVRDKVPFSPVY